MFNPLIPYKILREYSLIGKTVILHIINLGSSPNVSSKKYFDFSIHKAQEAQLAERNSEDV